MARSTTPKPRARAKKDYENIIVSRRKGALEITFNRPEVLNAINEPMADDIMDVMADAEMDRRILAIIFQGDERAFCAGADVGGFRDRPQDRYDNYRARYNTRRNRVLYRYMQGYTKPVISAVEGYCLGGGFELAMLGDIIVAGKEAQIGLPEARLGLIPGAGGTQNLPRLIGPALAKEMIWTARRLSAAEAKEFRIVNHVTPRGGALAKAREIVGAMSKNGPLAIMMVKQSVNRGMDMPLSLGFQQEADLAYMLTWSDDRAEGLKAFGQRRPANFKGQ